MCLLQKGIDVNKDNHDIVAGHVHKKSTRSRSADNELS